MESGEPARLRGLEQADVEKACSALVGPDRARYAERHRHWTEVTHDLLGIVAPPMEPRTAFDHVARLARRLTGASAVFVISTEGPGRLEVLAADGPAGGAWAGAELASLAAGSSTSPLPTVVTRAGWIATTAPLRTDLLPPCLLVLVGGSDPGGPTVDDVLELSSFANFAALVLDRLMGWEYHAEATRAGERTRLAAELHDGVIQRLFGVGLELQALHGALDEAIREETLERAIEVVDEVIVTLRRTIAGHWAGTPP